MTLREPVLNPVSIVDLRPTQMTVGLREVGQKRKHWREQSDEESGAYLGSHMIPVVVGPKQHHYVIDHHHLGRALLDEGVEHVLVNVIADFSRVDKDSFWIVMDCRAWCHPYDADGRRCDFAAIPSSLADMVDDPFRSLAGAVRLAGGYAKDTTPFSEFQWADFLRRRIKRKSIEKNFDRALEEALVLAKDMMADYLPGWSGPVSR